MITLSEFLLKTNHSYNGHLQTEITGMSVEDAIQLCKDLEEFTNQKYSFVIELWSDGNMTLYQKDFWKKGEHINGDTDRIILGINNGY